VIATGSLSIEAFWIKLSRKRHFASSHKDASYGLA